MNINKKVLYILPALIVVASGLVCFSSVSAKRVVSDGRHAKARYYYSEGSIALAEGRMSEAYELFKKAVATDPSYPEAAYTYAMMRMTLRNDTLSSPAEIGRSIALMRPYIDAYPEETSEAMNYAFLVARSGNLDEAIRVAERSDSLSGDVSGILLQLAQYYAAAQRPDKAIATLDRYERIEGPDPDLALRKFSLMFTKGDTATLIKESERYVRENPLSTEYMVIKGNVFEALAMPDSALLCYQKAEALDPDDGRVKLTLANYYLESGDSLAYDTKSREAILSDNIMLDEKLDMMKRYMQNIISDSTADRRRGSRLFDGLLLQYPHEPSVLDLGAQYFAATGNLTRAEDLMAYATDLEPENPDFWTRLTSFYFTDAKYADAIATAERGMGKLKDSPRGLLLVYATAASISEDYSKAREAYQKLLDLELPGALISDGPDNIVGKAASLPYESIMRIADIFQMVGDISFKSGDMCSAMREYDVVLGINPDNVMALNNYAYYLALGDGDLAKAEKMSRRAVSEQPENPTYLDTLAWILYLKGEYAEALQLQEKTLQLLTEDTEQPAEYWDHLGDIQYACGLRDKALESWKKALSLDKGNKEISEKVRLKRPADKKR